PARCWKMLATNLRKWGVFDEEPAWRWRSRWLACDHRRGRQPEAGPGQARARTGEEAGRVAQGRRLGPGLKGQQVAPGGRSKGVQTGQRLRRRVLGHVVLPLHRLYA